MRVSPGVLLVIIAIAVPFIVEFRTVAAYFGVGMSIEQTIAMGLLIIGLIVLWAVLPDLRSSDRQGPCR